MMDLLDLIMGKIKNILIVILFITIIILLLLKGCGNNSDKFKKEIETKTKIKFIDTITITHIDTIFKHIEKLKYIYISKPISSVSTDSKTYNTINTYQDTLLDSNVRIINTLKIQGELKSNLMNYELFVPYRITKTVINNITKTELVYRQSCYSFYAGFGIGGNKSQLSLIQPFIGLRKDKTYILGGYNLVDKTYNLSVGINIFNIR